MGPEVKDGPVEFGGLFVEVAEMSAELAFTKSYLEENNIQELSQLANHNIDLYSLNIDISIYRNFGSIFYNNTHVIAEIICLELTSHFATQASIILQENHDYCLYDAGSLVTRLELPKWWAEANALKLSL
ncbi:hypothetical protein [Hymenobacter lapidiphilus]|uniref:Uncharacterized protein n=1 Tax=Hymenobacter lapidiphilus TaxID=2608003 RepID=A0A7Y7PSA5_9BACT|nr:hypothetical protein [Hymenobacter lapidiphilus]NVO32792.1 hypothetical protein [Hymenobacter lapidiphilus]